jgi:CheY-like chemotaxis protein
VGRVTARIVVIEDNEDTIELIDILLRARGYVPLPATNGKDGMRIALLVRPDLILLDTDVIRLDIRMPGMDGDHVAAAIRNLPGLEHTRIVALTASTLSSEPDRIAAAGFDGYIRKPIDQKTFIDQVERFLSERPSSHDATADQS